ncbi:MAG: glycosyltransferase family 4 protein [Nitrososphaerales archaeon]
MVIPQWGRAASTYFTSNPSVPTVVDLYAPILNEYLFVEPSIATYSFARVLPRIAKALQKGDYFICGNQSQVYYYLGMLAILGRITPLTYGKDLISIVPYCVPNRPPNRRTDTALLRGKYVDEDDKVVLWCGGLYPWFDFETALKAMKLVASETNSIKMIVVGAKNPKAELVLVNKYQEAINKAKAMELLGKTVFFIDWVPFELLEQIYLESDVAINLHGLHLETIFSLRTRVIDSLWAGLPVISTTGDELAELINKHKAGISVPPYSHHHVQEAILTILNDKNLRDLMASNSRRLAIDKFAASSAAKPLNEFCKQPRFANDKNSPNYKLVTSRVQPRINHLIDFLVMLYYARKAYKSMGILYLKKKIFEFLKFG